MSAFTKLMRCVNVSPAERCASSLSSNLRQQQRRRHLTLCAPSLRRRLRAKARPDNLVKLCAPLLRIRRSALLSSAMERWQAETVSYRNLPADQRTQLRIERKQTLLLQLEQRVMFAAGSPLDKDAPRPEGRGGATSSKLYDRLQGAQRDWSEALRAKHEVDHATKRCANELFEEQARERDLLRHISELRQAKRLDVALSILHLCGRAVE